MNVSAMSHAVIQYNDRTNTGDISAEEYNKDINKTRLFRYFSEFFTFLTFLLTHRHAPNGIRNHVSESTIKIQTDTQSAPEKYDSRSGQTVSAGQLRASVGYSIV
ncbi:hypothetical protein ACS86V_004417 [Escherichia coli]